MIDILLYIIIRNRELAFHTRQFLLLKVVSEDYYFVMDENRMKYQVFLSLSNLYPSYLYRIDFRIDFCDCDIEEHCQQSHLIYTQYTLNMETNFLYQLNFTNSKELIKQKWMEFYKNVREHYKQRVINSVIMAHKQITQTLNQIVDIILEQDRQQILGYLNMQLGDQLTYSIQVQEQKPKFDENLKKIYLQFKTFNNSFAISQVSTGTDQQVYVFYAVPQTKIALSMLTYYEQKPNLNISRTPNNNLYCR